MQTFRAMNTEVTVGVPGQDAATEARLAADVARIFEESERVFSRFRHDSELSVMNRAGGTTAASEALFSALVRAKDHFERTFHLFDPTIGGPLVALGYDRSFAPGALDRDAVAIEPTCVTFADVAFDAPTRGVTLPPGVAIDLSGMVKGRTVDVASATLPTPSFVDAGGDGVLLGDGVESEGYLVDVEDPRDERRTIVTLRVRDRAFATSAPNRRRWRVGARAMHHLVDPSTGHPARSDLAQATVLAASAELADVLAKTAFLLGERAAVRFLERQEDVAAVLVREDGAMRWVGNVEVVDA